MEPTRPRGGALGPPWTRAGCARRPAPGHQAQPALKEPPARVHWSPHLEQLTLIHVILQNGNRVHTVKEHEKNAYSLGCNEGPRAKCRENGSDDLGRKPSHGMRVSRRLRAGGTSLPARHSLARDAQGIAAGIMLDRVHDDRNGTSPRWRLTRACASRAAPAAPRPRGLSRSAWCAAAPGVAAGPAPGHPPPRRPVSAVGRGGRLPRTGRDGPVRESVENAPPRRSEASGLLSAPRSCIPPAAARSGGLAAPLLFAGLVSATPPPVARRVPASSSRHVSRPRRHAYRGG